MAVAYPFTTEERIVTLAGQLAVDLRLDDSADAAADLSDAIDVGTADADYYLSTYALTGLQGDEWVANCATFFSVRFLCLRRLNEVPASINKECERREKQLDLVRQGKTRLRVATTRRAMTVTNAHVDLRKFNNQVRTDTSRSTGVAQDYLRPVDNTAPDER